MVTAPPAEEWRAVPLWEGVYEVSSFGRVRSLPRTRVITILGEPVPTRYKGTVLKPSLRNGYPNVCLKDSGRIFNAYVHRLACEAFHGPAPAGTEVAHTDGDRTNNDPENLRWATRRENMHDKIRHGRADKLGRIISGKITERDIPTILRRLAQGDFQRVVAADFRVDQSVISRLKTGNRRVKLCQ